MSTQTPTLKEVLETYTREGELYERLENGRLRCFACGHRCVIFDGLDGIPVILLDGSLARSGDIELVILQREATDLMQ